MFPNILAGKLSNAPNQQSQVPTDTQPCAGVWDLGGGGEVFVCCVTDKHTTRTEVCISKISQQNRFQLLQTDCVKSGHLITVNPLHKKTSFTAEHRASCENRRAGGSIVLPGRQIKHWKWQLFDPQKSILRITFLFTIASLV